MSAGGTREAARNETPGDFQTAYERAMARVGMPRWLAFSAREQTVAIYDELRILDDERWGDGTAARWVC
jgi:hypothetical protein